MIGHIIRNSYRRFERWRDLANSRKIAQNNRKTILGIRKKSVLNKRIRKQIREYATSAFGDPGYRYWLELYTEIRGEFLEGWIPDDYYCFDLLPKLNPGSISKLSMIKSYDHRLFNGFSIEPLAVRIGGTFYSSKMEKLDTREFMDLIQDYGGEVVVKIDSGPSGTGLFFRNADQFDLGEFRNGYDYLIQPAVQQHESLQILSESSVNTVRIVTVIDRNFSVVRLFSSVKFNVSGQRVDNVNKGGCFLVLDEHGNVVSGAYNELGIMTRTSDPDTGFQYRDLKIPSFEKAVDLCKEAHLLFPYVRMIAWDVYINEQGKPKLIEWNARRPGMWINEAVAGPLWKDITI